MTIKYQNVRKVEVEISNPHEVMKISVSQKADEMGVLTSNVHNEYGDMYSLFSEYVRILYMMAYIRHDSYPLEKNTVFPRIPVSWYLYVGGVKKCASPFLYTLADTVE